MHKILCWLSASFKEYFNNYTIGFSLYGRLPSGLVTSMYLGDANVVISHRPSWASRTCLNSANASTECPFKIFLTSASSYSLISILLVGLYVRSRVQTKDGVSNRSSNRFQNALSNQTPLTTHPQKHDVLREKITLVYIVPTK